MSGKKYLFSYPLSVFVCMWLGGKSCDQAAYLTMHPYQRWYTAVNAYPV